MKTQILTHEEITQKTRRMAYQIVEENYNEKQLVFIGIKPNGFEYAQQLKKEVEAINEMEVVLLELKLNKSNPLGEEIFLGANKTSLNQKSVILVDDVANTGKTLYYALKPLMEFAPQKVQAAVLIDRQHKLFPVTPDFVGLSLSTTLKERIEVEFKARKSAAYLL